MLHVQCIYLLSSLRIGKHCWWSLLITLETEAKLIFVNEIQGLLKLAADVSWFYVDKKESDGKPLCT